MPNCTLCSLWGISSLLLYSENRVHYGLGCNLDLLVVLALKPVRAPLFLYQLAKTGQDEFAIVFVSKNTPAVLLIGVGSFGKCDLQFCLGHVLAVVYGSGIDRFQGIALCRICPLKLESNPSLLCPAACGCGPQKQRSLIL
jgi:hypothetical protein